MSGLKKLLLLLSLIFCPLAFAGQNVTGNLFVSGNTGLGTSTTSQGFEVKAANHLGVLIKSGLDNDGTGAGNVTITSGSTSGSSASVAGDVNINGGTATSSSAGTGGNIYLNSGQGRAGGGGSVNLTGANSFGSNNVGGSINITAGNSNGAADAGNINFNAGITSTGLQGTSNFLTGDVVIGKNGGGTVSYLKLVEPVNGYYGLISESGDDGILTIDNSHSGSPYVGILNKLSVGILGSANTLDILGNAAIGVDYAANIHAPTNGLIVEGNTGIGLYAPVTTLDVNGSVRMTGFVMQTGAGSGKVLTSDSGGNGTWQTAGSGSGTVSSGTVNQVAKYTGTTTVGSGIITDNGTNIGIGSVNPTAQLDLTKTGFAQINAKGSSSTGAGWVTVSNNVPDTINLLAYASGSSGTQGAGAGEIYWDSATTPLFVGTSGAQPLKLITSDSTRMTIDYTGNIGIGSTNPKNTLAVVGNAAIGSTGNVGIAAPTNGLYVQGNVGLGSLTPGSKLDVQGTVRVLNGNVGIGSATPGTQLDINGTTRVTVGGNPAVMATSYTSVVTPSYNNSGGSGNRTSIITVTGSGGLIIGGGPSTFVDGSFVGSGYFSGGITTGTVTFDFGVGASKVINEAKWYQDSSNSQGTWKIQGSNDNSSYTDIGTTFTLGVPATQTITTISANTTGWRYYRFTQTAGSTTSAPYIYEVEFKIDTSVITTTASVGIGSTNPSALLEVGAQKFMVLTNGNIGIGTPTPTTNLDINGNARMLSTSPLYFGSDTTASLSATASTAAGLSFSTAGAEQMRVTTGGAISIGTTATGAKLSINAGNTLFDSAFDLVQTGDHPWGFRFANTGWTGSDTPNKSFGIYQDSTGKTSFYSQTAGNEVNRAMIFTASNNVGIGTLLSTNILDIGPSTTSSSSLRIAAGTAKTTPDNGAIWNDSTQNMVAFYNGNTLYQSGNLYTATAAVTINSTTPTTSFSGTKIGSTTIKANTLKVGQKFQIWGAGNYTTPLANTSTVTITTKIGSTTISTVTTGALPASATNLPFDFTLNCTSQAIGASAKIVCDGSFNYATALSAVAKTSNSLSTVGQITFDSTADQALDVLASWSAVTTQTATVQQSKIDFL